MTDLPDPLTTPDTDVTGLDGFLLDTERLLASELWHVSTGEEFKAAVTLWCRAWKQKPPGSLPNDARMLASYAGCSAARWNKIKEVALRGFVLCSDGRLYHKTLCEDVLRAHTKKADYRARTAAATAAAAEQKRIRDAERNVVRNGQSHGDVTGPQYQGGGSSSESVPRLPAGEPISTTSDAEALAPGAAPGSTATSPHGDEHGKLRARLGRFGFAASAQATAEWAGLLRERAAIIKWTEVDLFLAHCALTGRTKNKPVRFARDAIPLADEWRSGVRPNGEA